MTTLQHSFTELLIFGLKQARACVFAGSFFLLLFISSHIPLFGLPRYDFIFIGAILIQIILVLTKLETLDEVKVIFLFHIIGFILEVFKTNPAIGSWSYPEEGFLKLFNVPLYSGFMYASVGSYISQAWRIMNVSLSNFPPYRYTVTLCIFVYLNFFTHHFVPDFRWLLLLLVVVVFQKTWVYFTPWVKTRTMPISLAYLLMAFFIWIAENISTYLGAWKYPDQIHEWHVVSITKITSWTLLVIISFIIVADLKHFKKTRNNKQLATNK